MTNRQLTQLLGSTAPGARGAETNGASAQGLSSSPARQVLDPADDRRTITLDAEEAGWLGVAAEALEAIAELERQLDAVPSIDVAWQVDPESTLAAANVLRALRVMWQYAPALPVRAGAETSE